MSWFGCGIFFELENPIIFDEFGGIGGRLDRDMVAI
jgi:hypothetical protein